MSVMEITPGILIDDVETVVDAINRVANTTVTDPYIIKKFANTQKATMFYLDDKATMKVEPDKDTIYLWMDTGIVDKNGNAIFVSALNHDGEYSGHFVGNSYVLGNVIKNFFWRNEREINKNLNKFNYKYNLKIADRKIKHIVDEQQFYIDICNDNDNTTTEIGKKLKNLQIVFDDTKEEAEDILPEIAQTEDPEIEMSAIDILWDKIDELEEYIATLLQTIEELTIKSNQNADTITTLQEKNEEYKRALTQIRQYSINESPNDKLNETGNVNLKGHRLLKGRKVLVLGATEVNVEIMKALLKFSGFEKSDFEFETDYEKIKKYAGRVTTDGRYNALILGASPHKVSDNNGWSSLVEKFKNIDNGPYVIDVRNSAGELKITKTSFKMALEELVKAMEKGMIIV